MKGQSDGRSIVQLDQTGRRLFLASAGAWTVGCFLPALLLGLRPDEAKAHQRVVLLTQVFGKEVGSYLGYSPPPVASYVFSLLFFTSTLLLFAALWLRGSKPLGHGSDVLNLMRKLLAYWTVLSASGFALLYPIVRVSNDQAGGWCWRLGTLVLVTGFPATGISLLIATAVQRRARAVAVGLTANAVIGFWGFVPNSGSFSPGALDRALLAGSVDVPGTTFLLACAWLTIGTGCAVWVVRIRGRAHIPRHIDREGLESRERRTRVIAGRRR